MPCARWMATVALLISMAAQAATYYVSPSGNDGNSGTTTNSAWKTVAKVNGRAFSAGDQILFERGGEWHEALAASSSGAAGNPIVYDAYGSGAKPKFWGSDVIPTAVWTSQGNNIYTCNLAVGNVTQVLANHGTGTNGVWFFRNENNPQPANTFSFSGGVLRVNTTPGHPNDPAAANPNTDGRVWTAVVRQDVINSNGKDHLVFRNLQGDETADPDGGYVFRVMGSQDVLLDSCDAWRGGKHLFGIINSTEFVGKDLYAAYALPHSQAQSSSWYVSYADQGSRFASNTSKYINCIGEHFEDGDGGKYLYFVCHGPTQGPIEFINPTDRGGKFSFLQEVAQQTVKVTGGLIQDADFEFFCNNALIDGVKITGNSAIDVWGSDNVFQNCVLSIAPVGGGQTGYTTAILTRNSGSKRNAFRFNTITMAPGASGSCLTLAGSGQQTQWYGNIMTSNESPVKTWFFAPTAADAANTDYNLYNANVTFSDGGSTKTLAQWRAATGADAHSLSASPLFTDAANGDYTPQSGSPAIDAADVNAASIPAKDFKGNTRPSGAKADMGAIEVGGGSPPPPPPAPTITQDPVDTSKQVGHTATFSVTATGTGLTYRWQRNDADIPGAPNSNSYTTGALVIGDNGATFRCIVSNAGGSATSARATLTVTQAPPPPPPPNRGPHGGVAWPVPCTIQAEDFDDGAEGLAYHDTTPGSPNVYRTSDVDVEATPVIGGDYNVGSIPPGEWLEYTINVAATGTYAFESLVARPGNGGTFHIDIDGANVTGTLTIPESIGFWWDWRSVFKNGVSLTAGQHVMRITFDTAGGTGAVCNIDCVRITREDRAPSGAVLYEYWDNIPGVNVSDLTSDSRYPNAPTGTMFLSSFESPVTWKESFGSRLSGIVTAPATGNYTFYIAGDDHCELWVSSDDTAANLAQVASVPGHTRPHEWTKYPDQTSAQIALTAGSRYLVVALHKEGGNDDSVAVGWKLPDNSLERPIKGSHTAASNRLPAVTSHASAQPNPANIGDVITFSVAADDADSDAISYAWNFGDGTSATGSSATHAYAAKGTYSATVTISDGKGGSVAETVSVAILSKNGGGAEGDDGDGPGGGGGGSAPKPKELVVTSLAGSMSFKKSAGDSVSFGGVIPNLPADFKPSGAAIEISVGGAKGQFVLDAKGKSAGSSGSFQLRIKPKKKGAVVTGPQNLPFRGKLMRGSWVDDWADEGADPAASKTTGMTMGVTLTLNGVVYAADVATTYKGKAGSGAKFKK